MYNSYLQIEWERTAQRKLLYIRYLDSDDEQRF